MPEATFYQGDGVLQLDYTPSGAIAAGEVVQLGLIPYIAHRAIAADALGAVASRGGVYTMVGDGTLDLPGIRVHWDDTAKKVTVTASGNAHFGHTLPDQGATSDDDLMQIEHDPEGFVGA